MKLTATPASYGDPLDILRPRIEQPFPFVYEATWRPAFLGGWTVLSANPFLVLEARGRRVTLYASGTSRTLEADPFQVLQTTLQRYRVEEERDAPFPCGAFGYLSYDLKDLVETLPSLAKDDLELPHMLVGFYDQVVCLHPERKEAWVVEAVERRPAAIPPGAYREKFGIPVLSGGETPAGPLEFSMDKPAYHQAVRKIRDYIVAGDVYEVNFSQRLTARKGISHMDAYRKMRDRSKAWYSSLFLFGNRGLLSVSPEEYLTVRGDRVRTRPIKGTRPRGATPEKDAALKDELWNSPKDDAELAMVVDLERNDLGRVCEYGSVVVREPKVIETHETVLHLSATVEGKLRPKTGVADLLRAVFPGGSVTGAPKIRAMQIIEETERVKRGPYTGAIGWFGFDGSISLAMGIRTVIADDRRFHYSTGGAIVYDSDPEQEYEECLVKAAAFCQVFA